MDKHSGPLILELYVFYLWNKKLRFWGSGEVYFAQTPYRSDAGYLEESKPKNWDLTPYTRKISWWAALLVEFTIWCAAMNLFNRAGTNSWSLTIHNAISIPITGIRPAFRGWHLLYYAVVWALRLELRTQTISSSHGSLVSSCQALGSNALTIFRTLLGEQQDPGSLHDLNPGATIDLHRKKQACRAP